MLIGEYFEGQLILYASRKLRCGSYPLPRFTGAVLSGYCTVLLDFGLLHVGYVQSFAVEPEVRLAQTGGRLFYGTPRQQPTESVDSATS